MNGTPEITPIKPSEAAMTIIYKTIWQRIPNRSFVTGLWLRTYYGTELFFNCFTHVLPVKEYPYFAFYFGNIVLLTPGERALWTKATEEARIQYALDIEERTRGRDTANWGALHDLEAELLKSYAKHFPSTRGMFINYRYTLIEQANIVRKLNQEFWSGFK